MLKTSEVLIVSLVIEIRVYIVKMRASEHTGRHFSHVFTAPTNCWPMSVVAKWLDGSRCYLVGRSALAQATLH